MIPQIGAWESTLVEFQRHSRDSFSSAKKPIEPHLLQPKKELPAIYDAGASLPGLYRRCWKTASASCADVNKG
jgi:hypothetical protein